MCDPITQLVVHVTFNVEGSAFKSSFSHLFLSLQIELPPVSFFLKMKLVS